MEVIQINATVITGLLILLTFQSVTAIPNIFNEMNDIDDRTTDLRLESKKVTNLLYNYEYDLDNLIKNQNEQSTTENVGNIYSQKVSDLQSKINELTFQKDDVELELSLLIDERNSLSYFSESVFPVGFLQSENGIRSVGILMIIPFAISAAFESGIAIRRKKDDDKASKAGTVLMIIGFILVIIGAIYIYGVLQVESQSTAMILEPVKTDFGDISFAEDIKTSQNPLVFSEDKVVDNTIINTKFGFAISAPNIQDWELYNYDEKIEDDDYYFYEGTYLAAEIYSVIPNNDGYHTSVAVFVEEENNLTIKENIENAKKEIQQYIADYPELKYKINNLEEFVDPKTSTAILKYQFYGCEYYFDEETGETTEEPTICYESLEVETFQKSGTVLYNARGSVWPSDYEGTAPSIITKELSQILESFTLI